MRSAHGLDVGLNTDATHAQLVLNDKYLACA